MTIRMGVCNLHDAFLNAMILRRAMHKAEIIDDPVRFLISDRGRFERMWAAFLYILVEAWQADSMASVRDFARSATDVAELQGVLLEGEQDGSIKKLREVRHYMCHRDRREYFDPGRTGVLRQLDYNERLYLAFSRVLQASMEAIPR